MDQTLLGDIRQMGVALRQQAVRFRTWELELSSSPLTAGGCSFFYADFRQLQRDYAVMLRILDLVHKNCENSKGEIFLSLHNRFCAFKDDFDNRRMDLESKLKSLPKGK